MSDLGHDPHTRQILEGLQAAVNTACKPGRQFRAAVLIMVDEGGNGVRFVDAAGVDVVLALGYLEILKHTLVVHAEDE